jgi:hypothetical protein
LAIESGLIAARRRRIPTAKPGEPPVRDVVKLYDIVEVHVALADARNVSAA